MYIIKHINEEYYLLSNGIPTGYYYDDLIKKIRNTNGAEYGDAAHIFPIWASSKKTNGLHLIDKSKIETLIGKVNIELLAFDFFDTCNLNLIKNEYYNEAKGNHTTGYINGYIQALQYTDKKFTLEQLKFAIAWGCRNGIDNNYIDEEEQEKLINFLTEQKNEWSVDIETITITVYSKKWHKMIGETKPKTNEEGYINVLKINV